MPLSARLSARARILQPVPVELAPLAQDLDKGQRRDRCLQRVCAGERACSPNPPTGHHLRHALSTRQYPRDSISAAELHRGIPGRDSLHSPPRARPEHDHGPRGLPVVAAPGRLESAAISPHPANAARIGQWHGWYEDDRCSLPDIADLEGTGLATVRLTLQRATPRTQGTEPTSAAPRPAPRALQRTAGMVAVYSPTPRPGG